jgi:hypothetical protein
MPASNGTKERHNMTTTRTGYHLTPAGKLRHAHYLPGYGNDIPVWHDATTPHETDLHTTYKSFDPAHVVWAAANKSLTSGEKETLLARAMSEHYGSVKYVATAYYHGSETCYTFGPFTADELIQFMKNDLDPRKKSHEPWSIALLNPPALYATGDESSTGNYRESDWL